MTNAFIAEIFSDINEDNSGFLLKPVDGYTPYIANILSMMNFTRKWLLDSIKALTQEQLDFLFDKKANSIGAMLLHLAAVERASQIATFREYERNSEAINKEWNEKWEFVRRLGDEARQVKGHSIDYYLNILKEVRDATKKGFTLIDDEWFLKPIQGPDGKYNNYYWQWFHVCEHESHHRAQINLIKQRMP